MYCCGYGSGSSSGGNGGSGNGNGGNGNGGSGNSGNGDSGETIDSSTFSLLTLFAGNSPGAGDVGTPSSGPQGGGPLEEKMGLTPADAEGYDPSGMQAARSPAFIAIITEYDAKKDPGVRDPGELECQFDGPCCWNNDDSDRADWLLGKKKPDDSKYSEHFDTTPPGALCSNVFPIVMQTCRSTSIHAHRRSLIRTRRPCQFRLVSN